MCERLKNGTNCSNAARLDGGVNNEVDAWGVVRAAPLLFRNSKNA